MVTASVRFLTNNLVADLTCRSADLQTNLQSIGVLTPLSLIKLDNARTLQIQLTPDDNIGELINIALHKIEDANEAHLKGIFTVDFNSQSVLGQTDQRNKMIRNLINDFNKVDLTVNKNVNKNVIFDGEIVSLENGKVKL